MADRIIPFASASPRMLDSTKAQLLSAAKAAERALTLALGMEVAGKNAIVAKLRDAIARAAQEPQRITPRPLRHVFERPSAIRMDRAEGAQLFQNVRSNKCVCGRRKDPRRPFCRTCYFALPGALRAAMWLSPTDETDQLQEKLAEARQYLQRIGMFTGARA